MRHVQRRCSNNNECESCVFGSEREGTIAKANNQGMIQSASATCHIESPRDPSTVRGQHVANVAWPSATVDKVVRLLNNAFYMYSAATCYRAGAATIGFPTLMARVCRETYG